MDAPATTEPTRVALEDATSFARERLNRYRIELKTSSVFTWLREQWEEERERLRRDLETCARKDLDTLQISISVLGRVLARSSMEAFEKDLEGAVTALREYDGALPLFAGPTAKAAQEQEPAPAKDPLEEHDDGNDGGEGMCSAEEEAEADANWVTGDAMAELLKLGRGSPSALQHETDTAASGWIANVIEQTDWTPDGKKTVSAKLSAYCPAGAGGSLGIVAAPDLATLLARVIEADAKIDQKLKTKAGAPWQHGRKKGTAKRSAKGALGMTRSPRGRSKAARS